MRKRIQIPKAIEHQILMQNQNACCVCRKQNVQIHHIDGNPGNNALTNLCVLCIEHHAQASSKGTMTKGLEPTLLRKYKSHWESIVATHIRGPIIRKRTRVSKRELTNLRLEVKRTIFALPSLTTNRQIIYALDYLYHLNFDVHILPYILKDIGFLHWFMDAKHIEMISEKLHHFFWHLIGPHKVSFRTVSQTELRTTIELLADMGEQIIIMGDSLQALKRIIETLNHFDEIGKWYKSKRTRSFVREAYQRLYETCQGEARFNKSKGLQVKAQLLRRTQVNHCTSGN